MNHSGLVDLVHITNPEDIGSGLPPSTSEDAGKVLKVDAQGTPGWGEDAMATVDQNYDSTSTHAQSGLAVAQALSDVKEVPAVGSSDDNKVLKATYSGGVGSYSWETAPASVTVDQSYDASSANPQSGVAVAEAISGKQDTISDLATIRSGASAGATAVQPSSLAAVATTGSYNSLLDKPTIPAAVTVDQSYNSSSTNPQSGTAVAGAILTVKQVPATATADANKVLTVNAQGNGYEWVTPQSGQSYTAGDGIAIDSNNQIVVNHDATLKDIAVYQSDSVSNLISGYNLKYAQAPYRVYRAIGESGGIKLHIPGNTFWYNGGASEGATIGFSDLHFSSITYPKATAVTLSVTERNGYAWLDEQDVTLPTPINSQDWVINASSSSGFDYFAFFKLNGGAINSSGMFNASSTDISTDPVVFYTLDLSNSKQLGVANPLPSTLGTAGQVLAVNGDATGVEWVTNQTLSAGDGIDITNNEVAAKVGTGLSIGTSTKTEPVTEPQYSAAYTSGDLIVVDSAILLTSDIINAIDNNETITVVVPQYVDPNTTTAPWFNYTDRYVIGAHNNDSGNRAPLSAPSSSYYGTFTLNKSNIPSDYLSKWESLKASNTTRLEVMGCSSSSFNGWPGSTTVSAFGDYRVFDITMSKTTTIQNAINVDNPLPATLGTAGQVLAVNSGATGVEWISQVPIEVVASMPASPTAGVLYIVTGA